MRRFGEVAPTAGLAPRLRDLLVLPSSAPRSLEDAICRLTGLPDIEIVSTGTAALVIAFTTLKRRSPERSTVIVPGYTCPLVVIAAHVAGLQCVACDTAPGSFEMDLVHLAQLAGPDTLCVVPTHFGGTLTDVAAVAAAIPPGVFIVEDAAQAFGARWGNDSVGLAGDIGIFSFGVGKGFTLYAGGAFVARDPSLMHEMRDVTAALSRPSARAELFECLGLIGYHFFYTPGGLALIYGRPKRAALSRNDDIEAAGDAFDLHVDVHAVGQWRKRVGECALKRLPMHLAHSRQRFDRLAGILGQVPRLRVHLPPPQAQPTASYVFASLPPGNGVQETIHGLWASRMGVAKLFSRAIGSYPDLQPCLRPSDTPNARALAATTFAVTTHSGLRPSDETSIVKALERGTR